MSDEVHENWPERFSRGYVDEAVAAERERCAGAAKEIAESIQTEWVIDTDKAWAAGWKEASAAIEKKIRGEK